MRPEHRVFGRHPDDVFALLSALRRVLALAIRARLPSASEATASASAAAQATNRGCADHGELFAGRDWVAIQITCRGPLPARCGRTTCSRTSKPRVLQPLAEGAIRARRPDGEHAAGPQRARAWRAARRRSTASRSRRGRALRARCRRPSEWRRSRPAVCRIRSATSPTYTLLRGSASGWPAGAPISVRFHSTTSGTSSATTTSAAGPTVFRAAAKVNPMPRPPIEQARRL